MCIFQFLIDPQIRHKWLEKCYPKDKFDKSTRRICSIYFSKAAFIDNKKFSLSNQNINNLMLINFHISLITKRFFRSFDHHSDKTVTFSDRLPDITKFPNKILYFYVPGWMPLIYRLCYHHFNLKYERVWCIFNKI